MDYWGEVNKKRMGQYLKKIEEDFISQCNPKGLILDIGSGSNSHNAISIDINRDSLHKINRGYEIQADALHLPFRSNTFDYILAIQVLDYFELEEFLPEIRRVLSKNGGLIFSASNRASWKGWVFPYFSKYNFYKYNFSNIKHILLKYDFKINKSMGYSWIPFFRGSDSKYINVAARAEKLLGIYKLVRYSPWIITQFSKAEPG